MWGTFLEWGKRKANPKLIYLTKRSIMNLNKEPTIDELKELISKCDDENYNHIIWVAKNGTVHIYTTTLSNPTRTFESEKGKVLQFWKGVYFKGNNYFELEASNDSEYLQELYDNLVKNWEIKTYGHIEN